MSTIDNNAQITCLSVCLFINLSIHPSETSVYLLTQTFVQYYWQKKNKRWSS